MARFSWKPIC